MSLTSLSLQGWAELGHYLRPWHILRLWETGDGRIHRALSNAGIPVIHGPWNEEDDALYAEQQKYPPRRRVNYAVLLGHVKVTPVLAITHFSSDLSQFIVHGGASRLVELRIGSRRTAVTCSNLPVDLLSPALFPSLRDFNGALNMQRHYHDKIDGIAFPPGLTRLNVTFFSYDKESGYPLVMDSFRAISELRYLETFLFKTMRNESPVECHRRVSRGGKDGPVEINQRDQESAKQLLVINDPIWNGSVDMPPSLRHFGSASHTREMPFLDNRCSLPFKTIESLNLPGGCISTSQVQHFVSLRKLSVNTGRVDSPLPPLIEEITPRSRIMELSREYEDDVFPLLRDLPKTIVTMGIPVFRLLAGVGIRLDEAIGLLPPNLHTSEYLQLLLQLHHRLDEASRERLAVQETYPNLYRFLQKTGLDEFLDHMFKPVYSVENVFEVIASKVAEGRFTYDIARRLLHTFTTTLTDLPGAIVSGGLPMIVTGAKWPCLLVAKELADSIKSIALVDSGACDLMVDHLHVFKKVARVTIRSANQPDRIGLILSELEKMFGCDPSSPGLKELKIGIGDKLPLEAVGQVLFKHRDFLGNCGVVKIEGSYLYSEYLHFPFTNNTFVLQQASAYSEVVLVRNYGAACQ